MNNPAAFSATFADWKLIKTRKCVQIVFEVPLEAADAAYQVLGGMPDPSVSAWFGIAKLQQPKGGAPDVRLNNETPRQSSSPGGARSWESMTAAQQAGILCEDGAFQRFLMERAGLDCIDTAETVLSVRRHCGINSRSELTTNPTARAKWDRLVSEFRTWQQHPELVG